MKRVKTIAAVAGVCVVLAAVVCKVVEDENANARDVFSLRINAGEISPWVEDGDDAYIACQSPDDFFNLTKIDGGNGPYEERGQIRGFEQMMINGSGQSLDIFVMDFGTDASAAAMVAFQKSLTDDVLSVGTRDETVAFIDGGGSDYCTGYAHFGQFYIELRFAAYSDVTESFKDAASFIEHFESRVKSIK